MSPWVSTVLRNLPLMAIRLHDIRNKTKVQYMRHATLLSCDFFIGFFAFESICDHYSSRRMFKESNYIIFGEVIDVPIRLEMVYVSVKIYD